jgi:hypothetical protein
MELFEDRNFVLLNYLPNHSKECSIGRENGDYRDTVNDK